MTKYSIRLVALICLFSTAVTQALEPFSYQYKSTFAGFSAKSYRSLTQLEDGIWELRVASKNRVAEYQEVSRFKLDNNGYPIPLQNRVQAKLFGVKRSETTNFDWDKGRAIWTRKKDTRIANLSPGDLDRILYQLLIGKDVAKNNQPLSYSFINRGRKKTYHFQRLGTETIRLGKQPVETIKIRRIDSKKEKQTTVWLAPKMNYELVKIQHRDEDGADYSMELVITE